MDFVKGNNWSHNFSYHVGGGELPLLGKIQDEAVLVKPSCAVPCRLTAGEKGFKQGGIGLAACGYCSRNRADYPRTGDKSIRIWRAAGWPAMKKRWY